MQRRKFIKLVGWGAVTWPLVVHAQQPTKMKRIGLLRAAEQPEHELAAFLRALSQHGYVQGRNFVLVPQVGDGSTARLPELAAALVNQGVDIIVTEGTVAVRAAVAASSAQPIVTASAADPFIGGLVKNLSRPGDTPDLAPVRARPGPGRKGARYRIWLHRYAATRSGRRRHAPSTR